MNVLGQGAPLAHPEKFLVGVVSHQEGGPHAKEQDRIAGADEIHAPAHRLRLHQHPGVLQGGDVAVGHLVHDVRQLVGVFQLPALFRLVLPPDGHLVEQGFLHLPVSLEPQLPAHAHHRGGGRVALRRQLVDAALGRRLRVLQDPVQNAPLRPARPGPVLVDSDQHTFHRLPPAAFL